MRPLPLWLANRKKSQDKPFPIPPALGSRTLIMGILNVTPDSFSDGGRYLSIRKALQHALAMQRQGADLIDVGGESTRPSARRISIQEELSRILPVVEKLRSRLHIPISIDTSKALVAKKAIQAGAAWVNDVTALGDPRMVEVVAQAQVPIILMHMRGSPRTMQRKARYQNPIREIIQELKPSIEKARRAGIPKERIWIDPGIGFGKGLRENLLILRSLKEFKVLGFPVVVGPSRKSFIGQILEETLPTQRLFGTAATVAWAAAQGADMVRVHDVKSMRQIVEMTRAISEIA